jgi:hypothetical protein
MASASKSSEKSPVAALARGTDITPYRLTSSSSAAISDTAVLRLYAPADS